MKKLFWGLLLALPLLLVAPATHAFSVEARDNYQLPTAEIHDGNLYAAAGIINIDGEIDGDLIAAAQTLTVDGKIDGDLIAATQNLTINGEVTGSVRVVTEVANINGLVGRNVNALASTISLSPKSEIGSDLLVFGAWGNFNGLVNDSLYGSLAQATINGKVGRDVSLNLESDYENSNLFIGPDAVIGGNLNYTARKEASIENPEAIYGNTNYRLQEDKKPNWGNRVMEGFFQLAALTLIGVILLTLRKKSFVRLSATMEKKPWQTPLIGLLVLIGAPIIIFFLFFTVIGIPLALILLALYLVLVVIAAIYPAYHLGLMLGNGLNKKAVNPFLALILGLLVLVILSSIPWVGGFIAFVFVLFGLGALSLEIKENLNH